MADPCKFPDKGTVMLDTDVTDQTKCWMPVADRQLALDPKSRPICFRQLHKVVAVTYSQSAIPASGSPAGLYSVQTGTDKGLYWCTGVGAALFLTGYPENGEWPIT